MGDLNAIDKARLWDQFKSDLELEGRGKRVKRWGQSFEDTPESIAAMRLLDRMLQMETIATHVRPATVATFARVAADMRGDEFPEPGMEEV